MASDRVLGAFGVIFSSWIFMYAIADTDDTSWRCPQDLPDTAAMYTYRDQCYQFVDNEVHWPSARAYCMGHGGHLVRVDNAEVNTWLGRTLDSLPWTNRGIWIGLHDRNSELDWEWVTSSPLVEERARWTNWARGHPKAYLHSIRDCVRITRKDGWQWHETFCSMMRWTYKFICQYEARPQTTPSPASLQHMGGAQRSSRRRGSSRRHHPDREDTPAVMSAREDDGGMQEAAALQMEPEDDRGSALGLASTFAISGIVSCLVSVIVITLLLLLRRRRRQRMEDPTLQIDNPTYGPSGQDKGNAENEYMINVYTNPLELRQQLSPQTPPPQVDFSQLRAKSPSSGSPVHPQWDYINAAQCRAHEYLPMGGSNLQLTPSSENLRNDHIYEDIDAHKVLMADEPPQPEEDEMQIYEVLQDLQNTEGTKDNDHDTIGSECNDLEDTDIEEDSDLQETVAEESDSSDEDSD